MTALDGWGNFSMIVGAAAGTLIGLQFVAMSLLSGRPLEHAHAPVAEVFTTPTVVHFGAALTLAAIVAAPWPEIEGAAFAWAVVGVAGCVYALDVARRFRAQQVYEMVLEDRLFHIAIPVVAYAALPLSAALALVRPHLALFLEAAATLALLLAGIHNAWDIVTYHVFVRGPAMTDKPPR